MLKKNNRSFFYKPHFITLVTFVAISLVCSDLPYFALLLSPIKIFVTAIHELWHAFVCLLTGGTVSGLTIVSDNQGHGGLTFCHGGNPFLYTQAGYLGTAFFGCLLIMVSKFPFLSKLVLFSIGLTIAGASLFLMSGTIFQEGRILEGIGSIFWGLTIGAGFMWSGLKLKANLAHLLLLFIAIQTTLNAISGVIFLAEQSLGMFPGSWSDASNMAQLTGIPAFVWGTFWALVSIVMLISTLWHTYKIR